jgi:hypothetical protein
MPSGIHFLTDQPGKDLDKLGIPGGHSVDVRPVRACSQDLSVIADGRIVDPIADASVPPVYKDLALELRGRREPGNSIVSVESSADADGYLVIESEGRVVERIDLMGTFDDISVVGPVGRTTFRLANGVVSIEKASCRHQNCLRMGGIQAGRIICAPNRLVARVGGRGSGPWQVDAIGG